MTQPNAQDLPKFLSYSKLVVPALREVLPPQMAKFNTATDVFAVPFPTSTDSLLRAAIALTFSTWHSLVRDQGLAVEDAVGLMVAMVEAAILIGSAFPLR